MLTNLKMIYLSQKNLPKALAAVERILLLFPDAVMERRDRGLLCYQLGYSAEASQDLETYLTNQPNAGDAQTIRRLLEQLDRES
jgi:regulator of sirC expression with transglutaminase-like and TPR domain